MHDVGFNIIAQEAKDIERPLSEAFIRELNKTILVRPFWKDAVTDAGQPTRMEVKIGEYKSRPNHASRINWEKVVEITKASYLNLWNLANEKSY